MDTTTRPKRKPVSGWIALVLGCLTVLGIMLSLIAGYASIFDLPLFCFETVSPLITGLAGLLFGLFGLRAAKRRPAIAGVILNGLGLVYFLGALIWSARPAVEPVARLTPQPGGYDMAAYACQAEWYYPSYMITASGNRVLCGSKLLPANGLVLPLETVVLSNGESVGPVIWIEKAGDKEFLGGEYPVFEVQPGDHFTARFGCAQDQPLCNAEVSVHVWYESRLTTQKGTDALVRYDQPPVDIDLDLSDLAGERVSLAIYISHVDMEDWSSCQVTIIAPRISAHP
ncbi:MAG: hypothetical protein MUC85_11710 [Anaerolineales bacterium]|nr:hypothetical protein [Anaerolineales bacterium]